MGASLARTVKVDRGRRHRERAARRLDERGEQRVPPELAEHVLEEQARLVFIGRRAVQPLPGRAEHQLRHRLGPEVPGLAMPARAFEVGVPVCGIVERGEVLDLPGLDRPRRRRGRPPAGSPPAGSHPVGAPAREGGPHGRRPRDHDDDSRRSASTRARSGAAWPFRPASASQPRAGPGERLLREPWPPRRPLDRARRGPPAPAALRVLRGGVPRPGRLLAGRPRAGKRRARREPLGPVGGRPPPGPRAIRTGRRPRPARPDDRGPGAVSLPARNRLRPPIRRPSRRLRPRGRARANPPRAGLGGEQDAVRGAAGSGPGRRLLRLTRRRRDARRRHAGAPPSGARPRWGASARSPRASASLRWCPVGGTPVGSVGYCSRSARTRAASSATTASRRPGGQAGARPSSTWGTVTRTSRPSCGGPRRREGRSARPGSRLEGGRVRRGESGGSGDLTHRVIAA